MALSKGVNSYVTLVEAEVYFEDRSDVAAWTSASDASKSQALVTATSLLENILWTGTAVDSSQPLSFPRDGSYFEPRAGIIIYFDGTVPSRITKATMELAYHILNNDGLLDDIGGLNDIEVDIIKLKNIKNPSLFPTMVYKLIVPLKSTGGSTAWHRSN